MVENKEDIVKIPLLESLAFPLTTIGQHIKEYLFLISVFSFFTAIIFLAAGRSFFCFSSASIEVQNALFCSQSIWSELISFFAIILGGGFFINRWQMIAFENKQIRDCFHARMVKKDIKAVCLNFFFVCLWVVIVVGLYMLITRIPSDDWHKELLFFIGISFFIVLAAFLILNFVGFYHFLNGGNLFALKKTFWPIMDNIYVPFFWSTVYFLVFVFLFQMILRYFIAQSNFLPVIVNAFVLEFLVAAVVYFFVSIIQSFLVFQERKLFGKEK